METRQWLIISAFRYALGRRTYISSTMSEYLLQNTNLLSVDNKQLIINEIKVKLKLNELGDECDKSNWLEVLDHYIENIIWEDTNK